MSKFLFSLYPFHMVCQKIMSCLDVQLLIVQYSLEDCHLRPRALSRILHCPVPTADVARRYCQYLQSKNAPVTRFQEACGSGDLCILQWLTHEFKLTGVDARACNNFAFRYAAETVSYTHLTLPTTPYV